jgi:hypothetical protein
MKTAIQLNIALERISVLSGLVSDWRATAENKEAENKELLKENESLKRKQKAVKIGTTTGLIVSGVGIIVLGTTLILK